MTEPRVKLNAGEYVLTAEDVRRIADEQIMAALAGVADRFRHNEGSSAGDDQ